MGDDARRQRLQRYASWTAEDLAEVGGGSVTGPEEFEPIVLVAVWSAHRAAAFEASRWLMEELKSKAPFWKKEATGSGHRWVEQNTPG